MSCELMLTKETNPHTEARLSTSDGVNSKQSRSGTSLTQSNDVLELLKAILNRVERLETRFAHSVEKESYTVEDGAERLGRRPFTVRQWANKGQAKANKVHGKGRTGEWRIPHEELLRLQAEGPSAVGAFDNHRRPHLTRKAS
jgi:hypothetical protein